MMGLSLGPASLAMAVLSFDGLQVVSGLRRYPEGSSSKAAWLEKLLWAANEAIGVARMYRVLHGAIAVPDARGVDVWRHGELSGAVKTQLWLGRQVISADVVASEARSRIMGEAVSGALGAEVLRAAGLRCSSAEECDAYVVARVRFDAMVRQRSSLDRVLKEEIGT